MTRNNTSMLDAVTHYNGFINTCMNSLAVYFGRHNHTMGRGSEVIPWVGSEVIPWEGSEVILWKGSVEVYSVGLYVFFNSVRQRGNDKHLRNTHEIIPMYLCVHIDIDNLNVDETSI